MITVTFYLNADGTVMCQSSDPGNTKVVVRRTGDPGPEETIFPTQDPTRPPPQPPRREQSWSEWADATALELLDDPGPIIDAIADDGEVPSRVSDIDPDWDFNAVSGSGADGLNLKESAELLSELRQHVETDAALWEGLDPENAISTQAFFTARNAVVAEAQRLLRDMADDLNPLIDPDWSDDERRAAAQILVRHWHDYSQGDLPDGAFFDLLQQVYDQALTFDEAWSGLLACCDDIQERGDEGLAEELRGRLREFKAARDERVREESEVADE